MWRAHFADLCGDVQDSTHNLPEDQHSGQCSGNILFVKGCHRHGAACVSSWMLTCDPLYLHMKKYFLLFRYWNFLYGYYFTKTSFFAISVQFILTHKKGKPKPGAVEKAHWVQGRVFSVQEVEIPVLMSKLHLMEAVCFWTLGMIKRGRTLETPKQPI